MPAEATSLPAAIVLAGGRSTRMGGGDKSLQLLGGRPLLAHVLERLAPQAGAIAISANGDPARFAGFGRPVLPDTIAGQPGPLAGLLAGMEWAARHGATHMLSMPTDTPFFPADFGARLATSKFTDVPVLAATAGRVHPAIGLWPVALAARLDAFLRDGTTYRVSAFAYACNAVAVAFPMMPLAAASLDPFSNVNSPTDLAQAEMVFEELSR